MTEKARLHAVAKGRVQGVGFRYFVHGEAKQLGLVGWVRNLYSGDVEVLVEGNRSNLEQLVSRLRQGPRGSDVIDVTTEWGGATGEFQRFDVGKTV